MASEELVIHTEKQKPSQKMPPPPSPQRAGSWNEIKPALIQWGDFLTSLPEYTYVEEQYDRIISTAKEKGRLKQAMRELALTDRYFLLTRILRRPDARNQMIYKLCRMVEYASDGYLDLWAREHYKTSIITFAGTIQEILRDPEITIGIFSFTKPIAKSFLKQIARELEQNELLKKLFPEILWSDPRKESRKKNFRWGAEGIEVKRKGNPKEATVEAHGLVDGQPTSRHFDLRIYNDVVTRETVATEDAIRKTTNGWELSLNLGGGQHREWYEGTIYDNADTYSTLRDRGAAIPRIIPATWDGTETGEPILYTRERVAEKRRSMGAYNFSCQWLLKPQRAGVMGFEKEWIKYWPGTNTHGFNILLFCDPASSKKRAADYTTMGVIGLGSDRNFYLIDGVREKMSLKERTDKLFYFVQTYSPMNVYYEKYGKDSDIEHIEEEMDRRNYRFPLDEVGGSMAKVDRINRLQPDFENGRWFFPQVLYKTNSSGESYDVIYEVVNKEYLEWPYPSHDDFLDMLARVYDVPLLFPDKHTIAGQWELVEEEENTYNPLRAKAGWRV